MGNSSSAEEGQCVGYRVLGVQPNSPASAVGLVGFFDFIVAANGKLLLLLLPLVGAARLNDWTVFLLHTSPIHCPVLVVIAGFGQTTAALRASWSSVHTPNLLSHCLKQEPDLGSIIPYA